MMVINNADREVHISVLGPGSVSLWEADVPQGGSISKPIPGPIMYLATTFKTGSPQIQTGATVAPLTNASTVTIQAVSCGARYAVQNS